jgi:hypothetical protein
MTEREEYEADPQAWTEAHTVDGIRPHIPQSKQTHDEREKVMLQIMADWDQVADTGALNIIRGQE